MFYYHDVRIRTTHTHTHTHADSGYVDLLTPYIDTCIRFSESDLTDGVLNSKVIFRPGFNKKALAIARLRRNRTLVMAP